jgi:hypothetical protein
MRFLAAATTLSLLSLASANLQLGVTPISKLFARDVTCESGDVVCGDTCIPESYTCCPDKLGGCRATEVCQMGDNDEYGCCPQGEICSGDGGSEFIDEKSGSSSSSSTGTTGDAKSNDSKGAATSVKVGGGLVIAVAAAAALL